MTSGVGWGNRVISQPHFLLCWCCSRVLRKLFHLIQSGSWQGMGGSLPLGDWRGAESEDNSTRYRITSRDGAVPEG